MLPINGVYWGYNPFTNHLLTCWDIQVQGATLGISPTSCFDPVFDPSYVGTGLWHQPKDPLRRAWIVEITSPNFPNDVWTCWPYWTAASGICLWHGRNRCDARKKHHKPLPETNSKKATENRPNPKKGNAFHLPTHPPQKNQG